MYVHHQSSYINQLVYFNFMERNKKCRYINHHHDISTRLNAQALDKCQHSLVPRSHPDFISDPIFLHGCEIKSGRGLGTRLVPACIQELILWRLQLVWKQTQYKTTSHYTKQCHVTVYQVYDTDDRSWTSRQLTKLLFATFLLYSDNLLQATTNYY